ncbi:hypothetical protein AB7952_07845 [Streptomyces sp. PG2]
MASSPVAGAGETMSGRRCRLGRASSGMTMAAPALTVRRTWISSSGEASGLSTALTPTRRASMERGANSAFAMSTTFVPSDSAASSRLCSTVSAGETTTSTSGVCRAAAAADSMPVVLPTTVMSACWSSSARIPAPRIASSQATSTRIVTDCLP